ncbi:MAG: hypothetical protein Q7R30_21475 [Acidobacteriota bacterium]|nr:hypothetical protein [Acidobacteriota bacterium]
MIPGINYPWTVFEGRANYGCDFGRNIWNSHTGVSMHAAEVRADLAAMAATGVEVVRWFVFTDGRGGVAWNADGELAGIADGFFDDMDAALECASNAGVRLCLVLLDYSWVHDAGRRQYLASDAGRSVFLDRLIEPVLERYGHAVHSFDVINEPDWVTEGLEPNRANEPMPLDELRHVIRVTAERIHARSRALVTVGGGRVRFAAEWDHPDLGLDFIQVHSYPDVRYPDRDETVFGRTAASFGLTKPLLIGEHPSDPRVHPADHLSPAYSLEDYLTLARDGGYLGAWPWSFKGTDAFGAVDQVAMRAWIKPP